MSRAQTRPKDEEIAETAVVGAFVPATSDVDLEELIGAWDRVVREESNSIVPFVEQRQFLLLDELLPLHVVVRTAPVKGANLTGFLSRLSLHVEARAIGSLTLKHGDGQAAQPTQANEILHSVSVNTAKAPLICRCQVQAEDDTDPVEYVYSFWKVDIPIGRPKAKIQKLGIYFAVSATYKPDDSSMTAGSEEDYLPSLVPTPANLLEPFLDDPVLAAVKPYLSAARLTHTSTTASTPIKKGVRMLRVGPRRLFRAAPALLWRLRFAPLPESPKFDSILASFDFEITHFAGSGVSIDKADLELSAGRVQALSGALPVKCQPGDQMSLLFRLTRDRNAISFVPMGKPDGEVVIRLAATVVLSDTSSASVRIKWRTTLELASARPQSRSGLVHHHGSRATTSMSRDSKELAKPRGPDSLPITDAPADTESVVTVAAGISMTVSGPKKIVVGKAFTWSLFVINRSEKAQRLAIVPMPKRRRVESAQPDTAGSATGVMTGGGKKSEAAVSGAILDDQALYQAYKSSTKESTELICLSPDIRIGPLAASACYSTEIKFLPLAAGVLNLESLRLVDLTTQDATDIRDLPDIVAAEE